MSTLIQVIDRLDEVDDTDRYDSLTIYAEHGSKADPTARALICAEDEVGGLTCLQDRSLTYVLEVFLAKEAIETWSIGRAGRTPSAQDKFDAVMFYSQHDAYLSVEVRT